MTTAPGPTPQGVRARDADRQLVIDALSDAHANGQLTFDEFEERSRAASAAATLGELVPLTSDLQNAPNIATPTTADLDQVVIAALGAGGGPPRSPVRRLVLGLFGLGILAGVIVCVMLLVAAAVGGNSFLGAGGAQLHTADGFAEFVADAESEFGTTEVAQAVVYPAYAVVSVPVDGEPKHLDTYYYDGSFDEPTAGGTRDPNAPLVDLAEVDGGVVAQLVAQAPTALGVPDATSVYVIVEPWGEPARTVLAVYASDDYNSGGYLVAATDGHLIDAYPAGS